VHKLYAVLGVRFNVAMAELTKYKEHQGLYSLVEAPNIQRLTWNHTNGGIGWVAGLSQRLQSTFCRSHALHYHARGIESCTHFSTVTVATALESTKPRHWYTSKLIQNSSARDRVQIRCAGTITTFSRRI
jgi:hypothetical protein